MEDANLSWNADGLRSRITRRASSIAGPCMFVLWHVWHLHFGPHVVEDAKHWQYSLRHLDFLQVHPPA